MSTKMGISKLPSSVLQRPRVLLSSSSASSCSSTTQSSKTTILPTRISTTNPSSQIQVRHATFVPRPRRPYTFTQLVQLSDGSTYTVRTTMPQGLLKSTKDSRNHVIWQPSNKSLRNVEVDEAGKLAAFRERFGRGWDLDSSKPPLVGEGEGEGVAPAEGEKKKDAAVKGEKAAAAAQKQSEAAAATPAAVVEEEQEEDDFDSLTDLISSYAVEDNNTKGGRTAKEQDKLDKKK